MKFPGIHILLLVLMLLVNPSLSAQNWFPDDGYLYEGSTMARVDILIDQDYLDEILKPDNENSDHEYPAIFTFTRNGTSFTIDSVGFRLRGNTSRRSAKKSFKVSLNTFVPGQKFEGVEKINLNGEHNDPSIARAHVCWELFRMAGVPASRSGYTELYINSEYKGLYINVEHIDDEFVDLRFGSSDGNLYKCLWPADLDYLGTNPDDYKFESSGRQAYELKTNLDQNDYSDLASFVDILNNTDPDDFQEFLEPLFNVNSYLKNLVVEVLAGHWDAYSYNQNNYYLYHNQVTGKFEFIPYDTDNTLGISWSDTDWTARNIYNWSSGGNRPLTTRILENDEYRARYSFYMNRFLSTGFNSETLNPMLDDIKSLIEEFAEADPYRTYDYGYTFADFLNSFEESLSGHVREGIKTYISKRNVSALGQLEVTDIAPAISIESINTPLVNQNVKITALIEDEEPVADATAWFSEGGGEFTPVSMADMGGELYSVSRLGLNSTGYMSFYIEATDVNMQTTREPAVGTYDVFFGMVGSPGINYSSADDIIVYPIPAKSQFSVNTGAVANKYGYRLFNVSGQMLLEGLSGNSQFTIHLPADFKEGVYYLEVTFEKNGSVTHRSYKKVILLGRD